MTKGGTLTIGGIPFQAEGGICGFCSYDFAAGNGLPYGVMVDDAKAFCSANEPRCPTHSQTTPQTQLTERNIPASMTADAMVTIANVPFVALGGVCGFCQYGDSVDFQPGYGLPYGVGQEDARKFCSRTKTNSFRCPHPTPTPPPMKRADADGSPKNEILTISNMQFVWFGGLCDFCKTQEAYNFKPGHGLPYGVMPDDAMRYCKTMAMTCSS
jgi:hypothetical protein